MCSISGYITKSASVKVSAAFERILKRASDRGRDSWGVVTDSYPVRMLGIPKHVYIPISSVVIANNRAEPTTEWIAEKQEKDIQPFSYKGTHVSHNGTIANDQELRERYGLEVETEIDSAVVAPLVHQLGAWDAVHELVGSFALAIIHESRLYLACNYKPLFVKKDGNTIYFASLDSYLRENFWDNIHQLPPYSFTVISPLTLEMTTSTLYKKVPGRKVLVIASGGIDSTTVATHYVKMGADVTLLHFTYGCRGEGKEIEAVKAIGNYLRSETKFIDLTNAFKYDIGNSRLTADSGKADLMLERAGEKAAELAYEWVPARNLIFYSFALAYAEAHGYDVIALGNNLEESGAYPDNEMIFAQKFDELIPYAVNLGVMVRVEQPVGNLMKHEIVRMGLDLGAPFHLTWSCYEDGDKHCGTCGPCYMRKRAFKMNGADEVIKYENG